jgi:hypothetical protein
VPVLLSILLATCAAAAEEAAGGAAPPTYQGYVIGPDGGVHFVRTGNGASLETVAVGFPVNDLAILDGGLRLVLLPAQPPAGPKRGARAGIVEVAGISGAALHPGARRDIPIGGVGMRVVVDRDERTAYILTSSSPGVEAPPPTIEIKALELESGREIASTRLDRLPPALALHPDDRRLFFAAPDRIETYTVKPLAASWRYRSPGLNRALTFRPGTTTLFVARSREVAVFDPAVIAARDRESSRERTDDATAVIPLPFEPSGLLFSDDGRLAAAWGTGPQLALLDATRFELLREVAVPKSVEEADSLRPVVFEPEALRVACFPSGALMLVRFTAPPPPAPAPRAVAAAVSQLEATPARTLPPVVAPTPAPASPLPPSTVPSLEPARPEPILIAPGGGSDAAADAPGGRLLGHLTGRIDLVEAVVLYGPNSIVRERARVAPSEGGWSAPLPAPGVYRIVPLGEGSRPLRAKPNFLTVTVGDEGQGRLDFEILGLP